MPRIPSLVWAVPMTLALLVLAKGMLQSGAGPAERAAPGLVKRIEPPGRLHAPEDARPVSATPNPVALAPELERSDPPIVPTPQSVKPFVPQADVAAIAAPKSERPAPILYPVADDREVPRMASAFPRVDGAGPAAERLPNALESRHASPAAHATAASPLSEQALSAIRHQVSAMNQSAVKLAQRGALYSARAELLEALRLVAQAHDAQIGTTDRSRALAAAITAMDEADDFAHPPARSIAVADIVRPHHTPVLKRLDVSSLSPLTCSQHYYTYAQQQLGRATGGQSVAANPLSLLGMVHGNLAGHTAGKSSHTARAIVFHQAALAVDPAHYRSANELGVLWARCGELTAARKALLASLQSQPTESAWHNLAAVHDRLGERELAELARKEAKLLAPKSPREAARPSVEWLDPATFAAKSPAENAANAADVSAASHAGHSPGALWR